MADSELQEISPVTISKGEIPFDLLAMRQGKVFLECRKGFAINDDHKATLDKQGLRFFVRRSEWGEYLDYAQGHVKELIENKNIDPRVRAKAMHSINKQHFARMLENPYSEEIPQKSMDVVDNYVRYIITSPTAVENLFALASLDVYTYSHSMNVCTMSILMANYLKPDDRNAMITFGMAGLLHDMGKTKIDQAIITKEGRLTEEEFNEIKLHPVYSDEIIQYHGFPEEVREAGRSHHEKVVGGGYPDNLKGNSIPRMARMLAVVDVYDALTSKRSYKAEIRNIDALKIMSKEKQNFDSEMFKTLLTVVTSNTKIMPEVRKSMDDAAKGTFKTPAHGSM